MNKVDSITFSFALAALQRIARKPKPYFCKSGKYRVVCGQRVPEETCDCPRCIAKDTLEQMYELKAGAA